jgi:PAS domain S-box-containing protein
MDFCDGEAMTAGRLAGATAHAILEGAGDGIILLAKGSDAMLRVEYASTQVAGWLGIMPADLIGNRLAGLTLVPQGVAVSTALETSVLTAGSVCVVAAEKRQSHRQLIVRAASGIPGAFVLTFLFAAEKILLESVAADLPAPLTVYDANGRLRWANTAARRQYPADYQQLLGRPMAELVPEAPQRLDLHERALRGEPTRVAAGAATSPGTGEVQYFDMEYRGLRGDSGNVDHLLVFATDVTARRQAEARLRESEERFRGAFEFAAIGMALVAPDGRWLRVNRSMCRIVGYTADELLATTFQAITHPDDLETDVSYIAQMLDGSLSNYHMEKRYFHKDGHILWILLSVSLVRDAVGHPLYFVSQIQDITERRQLTDDLRRARADLQAILDNVPARITSWNADSTNHFVNRVAAERYGVSALEAVGKHMSEILGHERYARARPFINTALAGTQQSYEQVDQQSDGSLRYSHVEFVPKRLDGKPAGLYALATDVTDLRESYRRIRELAQRLETVREEERCSIAQELHEGIAQNLFAMKLNLDRLRPQSTGRAGVTQVREELVEAVDRCMVDTRQIANDLRPSALAHLPVSVALREHARYFGNISGLTIRVTEIAPIPVLEEATALILFRAAQEALTNVARHARAATVDIVLRADAESITMDITDDGIGISDDAFAKAGSLGLLGIRERIDAFDGSLVVRKNAAAGTMVSVRIPRIPGPPIAVRQR